MQFLQYVDPIIKWVPTLLFLLIVLTYTFIGFCRGYRKSLIFFIHSLIIGGVFITLFFLFKESKMVDELLLKLINLIMGSETALQDLLEVSQNATSLREVLALFIPTQLDFMDGLSLILADNGAYLLTLVDLLFSIVFALLFYILYLVFELIMTIIYYIFYSNKKYKKKMPKRIMKGKKELGYSKKRFKGSLIGLTRGLISGLIMLSLLGSLFFVVSGGRGDEESPRYDLGNEDFTNIYNAYASISEYGSHGIFKVLNTFKNNKNVPYYLFAADVIFSGELKLEEDFSHNIIFREEFATYVDFSKDILNLMMKYGADDVRALVNGSDDVDVADAVLEIMVKKEFQTEFEQLIQEFDSKVFISGFTLSFVDSFIAHMDETDFGSDLDDLTKDLLSILFKKGYLCESIPYEYNLKQSLTQGEEIDLGHISSRDLINKDNVIAIYKIITDILYFNNVVEEDPDDLLYFEMMNNTVDNIAQLSLFNPDDSERLNDVYRRLYAYIRYNILDEVDEDEEEVTAMSAEISKSEYYIDKEFASIDWTKELRTLLNVAKDALYIYQYNEIELGDIEELLPQLFDVFQSEGEESEITRRLNKVIDHIATSKLMANVVSSKMIMGTFEETLTSSLEGYLMPELNFSNVYDEKGHLVSYGEVYYFINTLRELLKNSENKLVVDLLLGEAEVEDETDMILQVCDILTSEANEQTIDYFASSKLFRSIFTVVLDQLEMGSGKIIYLDGSILDTDSNGAKVITKEEFSKVIYLVPDLIDLASPLLEDEPTDEDIVNLINDERINKMLDCRLIEGTFSNVLVTSLDGNEELILPKYLTTPDENGNRKGLVSDENGISEIKSLININNELFKGKDVGFDQILSGDMSEVIDIFTDAKDLNVIFDSGILYYTISNYLLNTGNNDLLAFRLVIPASCRIPNNTIPYIIEKEVLVDFFEIGRELFTEEENEEETGEQGDDSTENENAAQDIVRKIVINNSSAEDKYLSNEILSASLMTFMLEDNDMAFKDFISIPVVMVEYVSKMEQESNALTDEIIYSEAMQLCSALDTLLQISANPDSDIFNQDNEQKITDNINDILNDPENNKEKFDAIYESKLIAATLTTKFDEYLISEGDDALIAGNVKYCSEVYDKLFEAFLKEEIYNCILAMNAMGITGTSSINKDSFKTINDEQKAKVYKSTLALGIISYMIDDIIDPDDGEATLRTTTLAYQEKYLSRGIHLYKESEIDAILELLGDLSGSDDFDIKTFDLEKVKNIIFHLDSQTGEYVVNSYISIATITMELEKASAIYIPLSVYDTKNKVVKEDEFLQLLDSMSSAGFSLSLEFSDEGEKFMENFVNNIDEISKSEILRATISKKININISSGDDELDIDIAVENSDLYRVIDNRVDGVSNSESFYYLSIDEFKHFFEAINILTQDGGFEISMNYDAVYLVAKHNTYDKDGKITGNTIIDSSLMCTIVNDMLSVKAFDTIITLLRIEKENTELADIVYDEIIELDEFSVETLLKILNELAKFN